MSVVERTERRPIACARCSQRKQRCDRKLPTCTQCDKASVSCDENDAESGLTLSSSGTTLRKGPVRILEDRIANLRAQLEDDDLTGRAQTTIDAPLLGGYARDEAGGAKRTKSQQNYVDQSNDAGIGFLSMRALAEPRNRASEFLQELSMPKIISAMTQTYGGNPEKTSQPDALWADISKYIRGPMSADTQRLYLGPFEAQKALQTYLEVVDFRYPRLPVAKVKRGINAVSAIDCSDYTEMLENNPAYIFLAYMVIAIVPLVSDIYPVVQGSFISMHLLAKCLKVLEAVFLKEDGVDIIQCLHLLVVFSVHSSAAGSSWQLIGIAMKKCIALGYHQEDLRLERVLSEEEIEQRRWAFWSCCLLDRLISAALGRPYSVDDRYISVPFPRLNQAAIDCVVQSEAQHVLLFRYCLLLSRVTKENGLQSFSTPLSHILHWRVSIDALPQTLDPKAKAYLVSLHHTLLLRLLIDQHLALSRKISCDQYQSGFSPEDAARAIADRLRTMKAAQICASVMHSLNRPEMRNRSFLSWITGYSTLSAALMALYCLQYEESMYLLRSSSGLADGISPFSLRSESTTSAHKPCDWLSVARRVIDIVARQFPSMQRYCQFVLNLQQVLIDQNLDGDDLDDVLLDIRTVSADIGPEHLRDLATLLVGKVDMR